MKHQYLISILCFGAFIVISSVTKGEGNTCYDEGVVVLSGVEAEHPYYNNIDSATIDVYAYLLQPFPSGLGIDIDDFYAAMDTLSNVYDEHGVSFNLVGYEYFGISQFDYYSSEIIGELDTIPNYPNAITMIFTDPDAPRIGWAWSIPSPRFVVGGSDIYAAIAHEMGHCLSLYHTFDSEINGPDYPWLMDGLYDCGFRGDNVCDTPAVPEPLSNGNYIDPNSCSLTQDFFDEWNDGTLVPWQPLPTNQMEYTPDSCRDQFTTDQVQRILANIENGWGVLDTLEIQVTYKTTPEISTSAEFPIIAGSSDASTVIAVAVSHPNGYNDMLVTMDATKLGGPPDVALLDDGVTPDLVDDDGIYTSPPMNISVPDSIYNVEVSAYAPISGGGNHSFASETVQVVAENTGLKFVDGSDSTGDLVSSMSGEPYANSYFETEIETGSSNVLVLTKNNSIDQGDVFEKGTIFGGVPEYG